MYLVIELIDDNGRPFSDEDSLKLAGMLLEGVTEETYGCLELTDLEGRAVLARVEGTLEPLAGPGGPYDIKPLEA